MAASFIQTYANAVSQQLDFLPTWPVDYDIRLGDVGILEGSVFRRTDTLERLGLGGFGVRSGRGEVLLEFTSKDGVEVSIGGKADSILTEAGGEVEVKFSREGAVFLRVGDHTVQQIESIDTLAREIIERFKRGEWQRSRVIVTEVVSALATTLLVSGGGAAEAGFTLQAGLPAQAALAGGKFSLKHLSGEFAAKVIAEGISPLLRTSGLKRKFLTVDFRSGRETAPAKAENLLFGRVDSSDQVED